MAVRAAGVTGRSLPMRCVILGAAAIAPLASAIAQDAPGQVLFVEVCGPCHLGNARLGPSLTSTGLVASPANLVRQILVGDGPMAGLANVLTDEEIAAIANYVRQVLNHYPDPVSAPFVADIRNSG